MAKPQVKNRYFEENNISYFEVINTKNEKIYFIVDRDDKELLDSFTWYANYCPKRKSHFLESKYGLKFHRAKMNTPEELVVDHINRCTYDNRLSNLRNVTPAENSRNIRRPPFQTNPKGTNTGIDYISFKNNRYYDVRYHKFKRKCFLTLEDARNYLNKLINMEKINNG